MTYARVAVQYRVRIGGIDAREKGQPFANAAKGRLSELIFGKQVRVHCWKRDPFGREVCDVLSSLHDIGLEPIREGMAWHAARPLWREEETARAAERGLSRDAQPIAPWHGARPSRLGPFVVCSAELAGSRFPSELQRNGKPAEAGPGLKQVSVIGDGVAR